MKTHYISLNHIFPTYYLVRPNLIQILFFIFYCKAIPDQWFTKKTKNSFLLS